METSATRLVNCTTTLPWQVARKALEGLFLF